MLIFTRNIYKNEIMMGKYGDVSIKILSIKNGQVRFGITAPNNVPIHRREVLDRAKGREDSSIEK